MDDNTWLLGNINQTGYFRVNYDLQNWKLLIQQLHANPEVRPSVCLCIWFYVLVCLFVNVLSAPRPPLDHFRWKQGGTY